MAKWTIPGSHTVSKDYGADVEISSSHHDFKAGRFRCILEMRDGSGNWLGPKVVVETGPDGTVITDFQGTRHKFDAIDFAHAGVQGLLDQDKIIAFVSTRVLDPRGT